MYSHKLSATKIINCNQLNTLYLYLEIFESKTKTKLYTLIDK